MDSVRPVPPLGTSQPCNKSGLLKNNPARLSARVPSSPTLHASFSQEPRRYRSVCWAARKSDCTAIARAGPRGWEWQGLTVHPLSRDVDPGKPEQKAGRESRLARLSSRRDHESEGLRGSAIALRLPEERSRPGSAEVIPKTARNSGGSARRARCPTATQQSFRAPLKSEPYTREKPDGQGQSGQRRMERAHPLMTSPAHHPKCSS